MCSRGVKQAGALTLTTASRGAFATDAALRSEFHALLGARQPASGGLLAMPCGPPSARL